MEEKNKKRQIAKISIFITSIFVIFMSITYAFITQTLTGTKEVVINAGVLDLVLEEENAITISDAFPMYDQVGMIQEDVFEFRLVNKTSNPTNYVLKMLKSATTNQLSPVNVKYYLTKEGVGEPKLLSSLPLDGTVDSGIIVGNDTIDYTLRLWIKDSVTDQNLIAGKSLSYKLVVDVSQKKETFTLAGHTFEIEGTTDTFPDFGAISSATNGRGIYRYQEDGEDIYYWRGKVSETAKSDNHVIFAGYCWQMVRTTKTGGIKMIYNGIPVETDGVKTCPINGSSSTLESSSVFNQNKDDNAYVGYMYGLTGVNAEPSIPQCIKLNSAGTQAEVGGESTEVECIANGGKWATTAYESTHANVVNSTIKTAIDTWFEASELNKEENLAKIEDAVYCSDRSIDSTAGSANGYTEYTTLGYGANKTVYNAAARVGYKITNPTPSLECTNQNDRFTVEEESGNGDLTYPVGLLTADEIVLAGGLYNASNPDSYLYRYLPYWTLSPYMFDGSIAGVTFLNSNFQLQYHSILASASVGLLAYIRPVISLVESTTFSPNGMGTADNPYIVE